MIETVKELELRTAHITTPMDVSIIGCVVNGPGEAKVADIGFSGGGRNTHQVYINGAVAHRFQGDGFDSHEVLEHLVELIEAKSAEISSQKNL